jgi:Zn-dependent protease
MNFAYFLSGFQLLIAVILHEVAHGKVAEWLGDSTARSQGRITLNPLKHIDPFMTIVLPGLLIMAHSPVIFGGAKPVPVNPYRFRDPPRGMAIVAIAGPITNLIICAFWVGCWKLIGAYPTSVFSDPIIGEFVLSGIFINLVLALFNLIPIPPLDGGRIAVAFLPNKFAHLLARVEPFGFLVLFALLYSGRVQHIIQAALEWVAQFL